MPSAFNPSVIAGGSGSGDAIVIPISQSAHGLSAGNWVYKTSTGYALADSDGELTADCVGVVKEVVDANNFKLQTHGLYTGAGVPSGTSGAALYVSNTSGLVTTTYPTSSTGFVKPMGILLVSGSSMLINIMRGSPAAEV